MFVGKRHNPLQASGRVGERRDYSTVCRMVMRTKIKEIIATGGNLGMGCGEIFFFPGGFGCWFVLFILILW